MNTPDDSNLPVFVAANQRSRSYAARVGVDVSLLPLLGVRGSAPDAAIIIAAYRVVSRWRGLVSRLMDYKSRELINDEYCQTRLWRMFRCRPSAFFSKPRTISCGCVTICPHCWSRAAIERWQRLDHLFFGVKLKKHKPAEVNDVIHRGISQDTTTPPSRSLDGYTLFRRQETRPLPFDYVVKGVSRASLPWFLYHYTLSPKSKSKSKTTIKPSKLSRHSLTAAYKYAGAVGGLDVLTISPAFKGRGEYRAASGWKTRRRTIFLVPTAKAEAFSRKPRIAAGELVTLLRLDNPTRNQFASWIAWSEQYPRALLALDSPPERIVQYLEARKDHNLVATFGGFRGHCPF